MASLRKVLNALRQGVNRVTINDRLQVPVYDDLTKVPNPEVGTWVYVTGAGAKPEGFWRYTEFNVWEAGGVRPRHNSSITQRTMTNGEKFVILQFNMPEDAEIVVWESLLRNTQGNNNGLFLQIEDIDAGETIYEYDASQQAPAIDFGSPLARGGTAGNQIRIRGANNSGQDKEASGYVNWTFEGI